MINILKQWRVWVLAVLLIGPVLAYVAFGTMWLYERGWLWLTTAALLWIAAGTVFSILAARWTKSVHPIMPPRLGVPLHVLAARPRGLEDRRARIRRWRDAGDGGSGRARDLH